VSEDDVLFGYRLQLLDYAARTSVSEACRTFGVHRSTFYRCRGMVERHGLEVLRPRERRARWLQAASARMMTVPLPPSNPCRLTGDRAQSASLSFRCPGLLSLPGSLIRNPATFSSSSGQIPSPERPESGQRSRGAEREHDGGRGCLEGFAGDEADVVEGRDGE
jgi:transposase-like protein